MIVEASRARDELQDPAPKLSACRSVFDHQLGSLLERELVPVLLMDSALGHRVEAVRPKAFWRKLRAEPSKEGRFGCSHCVLGDLGERDVGSYELEPRADEPGLEMSQAVEGLPKAHTDEVG